MILFEYNGQEYKKPIGWSEIPLQKALHVMKIDIPQKLYDIYKADGIEREELVQASVENGDFEMLFPEYYGKVIKLLTTIPQDIVDYMSGEARTHLFNTMLLDFVMDLLCGQSDCEKVDRFKWGKVELDEFGFYKSIDIDYRIPKKKEFAEGFKYRQIMEDIGDDKVEFWTEYEVSKDTDLKEITSLLRRKKIRVSDEYIMPEPLSKLGVEIPFVKETVAAFVESSDLRSNITQLSEGGEFARASNIVAILCRKKGEKYDRDLMSNRAIEFNNISMDIVFSVFFYITTSCNILINISQTYSQAKHQKETSTGIAVS